MKALKEMNDTEKAYLLASLFPETLKELLSFVQEEIEHHRKYEQQLSRAWPKSLLEFWLEVVQSVEDVLKTFKFDLPRSPKLFSDQLFYGHNSVFLIHCLLRYLEKKDCPKKLTYAINLLFGEKTVFVLDVRQD